MIPTEYKLHKHGFTVLRTVKHKTSDILRLKECKREGEVFRFKHDIISQHPSQAAMNRELKELLKDPMTVVMNENDRSYNDKLVRVGFTIIRLEEGTARIKEWCSNQAWRTLEKYDSLEQAKARYDELLKIMICIEG